MHPIAARVSRTIRRHDLIPAGGRVLAAVSGGSDSVALARLLRELESGGALILAGLVHFNHQLRGEASDADEAFCRRLAEELSVPFERGQADVAELARSSRLSIEDAGRRARYTFLEEAANVIGAGRIAVGHTSNDQAETFLLRLIRGAGPRGLAGIHPRVGAVVRPLLDVSREELRGYLSERGQAFREDPSNLDVEVPRNRVRHELMPLLISRFSPAAVKVIAREAAIAREDARFLDRVAADAAPGMVIREANGLVLDIGALMAAPHAVAYRVVRQAVSEVSGGRFIGFDHVESVLTLAASGSGGARLDLPGAVVERLGPGIVLRSRGRARGATSATRNSFHYLLSIPGEVRCLEAGCVMTAEEAPVQSAPDAGLLRGRGRRAIVDAGTVSGALTVRSRRPGDAFRPLGLAGRKKLQDFFVDRKIARDERDRIPIVVDSQNRVVWIAGHAVGDEFRVSDRTRAVVILTLRDLGGSA